MSGKVTRLFDKCYACPFDCRTFGRRITSDTGTYYNDIEVVGRLNGGGVNRLVFGLPTVRCRGRGTLGGLVAACYAGGCESSHTGHSSAANKELPARTCSHFMRHLIPEAHDILLLSTVFLRCARRLWITIGCHVALGK